jgi:hypothetical protein
MEAKERDKVRRKVLNRKSRKIFGYRNEEGFGG